MSISEIDFQQCRFCSDISQAVGESPTGTAGYYDYWLVVELPQPWSETAFEQSQVLKPYLEIIKFLIYKKGMKIRPLAIASDPEYSQPGYTRVLFYRRPQYLFARYQQEEYLIPDVELGNLVSALLVEPERLIDFNQYQQDNTHQYDILICTHGNIDVACSRYGYPLYENWRKQANSQFRVWRCSHFGGHRFAPTAISLPDGRYWGHLVPEALSLIIKQKGNLNDIKSYYRGWAGVNQWVQIAEGEIWLNHGWDWCNYLKAGEVLEADKNKEWATVRIHYSSVNGEDNGTYNAKIESIKELTTAGDSGSPPSSAVVKQYQATILYR